MNNIKFNCCLSQKRHSRSCDNLENLTLFCFVVVVSKNAKVLLFVCLELCGYNNHIINMIKDTTIKFCNYPCALKVHLSKIRIKFIKNWY